MRGTNLTNLLDDEGEPLSLPKFIANGIPSWEEGGHLAELALDRVEDVIDNLHPKSLRDDKIVEEEVRRRVRRLLRDETGKKPICEVRVMRPEYK